VLTEERVQDLQGQLDIIIHKLGTKKWIFAGISIHSHKANYIFPYEVMYEHELKLQDCAANIYFCS
jgi:hypothetical protein